MARKMTNKERIECVREWVLFGTGYNPRGVKPKFDNLGLRDVLPFPIRSGIFERMTAAQIKNASQDLEHINPIRAEAEFNAIWDRVAADILKKCRPPWWRRLYVRWGKYRYPRARWQ